MKKVKKILKWTAIIILVFIAGISVITASRQNVKYEAKYPDIKASKDSAVIAKGKHIMFGLTYCAGCHSTANADSLMEAGLDVPLTGGKVFDLPFGKVYSKNITPDSATGIGKYTDAEIARALRYGVHPDGTVVFDFMPFHNVSDEDLTAIISYLRAQPAVKNEVPDNTLNVIGKVVKAFLIKPVGPSEEIADVIKPDSTVAYGRYLVTNVSDCGGCHTTRDMTGSLVGAPLAGGNPMHVGNSFVTPPNITPIAGTPVYEWDEQMFINRFRAGKPAKPTVMPWNAFKRMSDLELKAIYRYLRTVQPSPTNKEK